jgi:hypothetical protein
MRPFFLITIDTEGDDLWSRPTVTTTRNAAFVGRFQELCEQYGLRPTWLTNYEMIQSAEFRSFAAEVVSRGAAEIGMHLHGWDSPPLDPLTDDDAATHPYLVEYPAPVMREKIRVLTAQLEDSLGVKMVSHRAGRWAFDERYAEMLLDEGYKVDCSVTPLVNWATTVGAPDGRGGTDYRAFPQTPYWLDLEDISRPGTSSLLEVPMTVVSLRSAIVGRVVDIGNRLPVARGRLLLNRVADRLSPPRSWLRPTGRNAKELFEVVDFVTHQGLPHAEFMLHSSELMPGGSPTFPDEAAIDSLYRDLDALFAKVARSCRPATLSEFHDEIANVREAASGTSVPDADVATSERPEIELS